MILKIRNTTNQEYVLRGLLFREVGAETNNERDIPELDMQHWGNDEDTQLKLLSGDAILSVNTVDMVDKNSAINLLKNMPIDRDATGREIVRLAATDKGWHYQAHSVQFEVNKLGSVYNKDRDGNDLGFTTMKVYDATGVELTTQADVDLYGVKTVCKWSPSFDLDIISGNVRQATKESIDSYIYVDAVVPTGYPSPYDKLYVPFTTGGINLKYIGADEQLKTDGRAGKTIRCSQGAYFEITVNYPADILTNENRHELSVIFEIYKDPTV